MNNKDVLKYLGAGLIAFATLLALAVPISRDSSYGDFEYRLFGFSESSQGFFVLILTACTIVFIFLNKKIIAACLASALGGNFLISINWIWVLSESGREYNRSIVLVLILLICIAGAVVLILDALNIGTVITPSAQIKATAQNAVNTGITDDTKDEYFEEVRKYKALLDDGVITEEQFTAKKKEYLGL